MYAKNNNMMDQEEGSLVLEEQIDPNYVPTKEGISYWTHLYKTLT